MAGRRGWLWLALVLSLGWSAAAAQDDGSATLRVRVLDDATGQAIAGSLVGFPDLKLFVLSDASGTATISSVPMGDHRLEITMIGYGAASSMAHFGPRATVVGTTRLSTRPIPIAGLTVESRRQSATLARTGFYDRAKAQHGVRMDEWAMDSLHITTLGDVLQHHSRPDCIGFGLAKIVPLTIYLNGRALDPDAHGWESLPGYSYNRGLNDVLTSNFEGLEYYTKTADVPVGFPADCGVLLLWMK
jgi:hypothetical protein